MYNDRLIKVERILPNPMRDLDIYPIHRDRIDQLTSSYKEGDFGTIIPVRHHPVKKGYYQQACGHHRIAAMQADGRPLEILCRIGDFGDDEMARIMVRENMNNYGNNPEAVADSVAAISKVLIYWMFLAEDYGQLRRILPSSCPDPFGSVKAFDVAKGNLIKSGAVGVATILHFFGDKKADWPMSETNVKGALAALNGTNKMRDICKEKRTLAERKLAAQKAEEIKNAEDAERKVKEAEAAQVAYEAAEIVRKEKRKADMEEAKKLKGALAKKKAEAALAQAKADADKERRRMKAMAEERERLEKEAKKKRDRQASLQAAQDKAEKAKKNAEESVVEAWLHPAAFGLFENQGQFDAFRTVLTATPSLRAHFPVIDQPALIQAMLDDLNMNDNMTAAGIKKHITDKDEHARAQVRRKAAERLKQQQEERERYSKQDKVTRVMDDFVANLAKLSRSFGEVDDLLKEPESKAMVMASPHGLTLRGSLENLYQTLPLIEKVFRQSARQFDVELTPEERNARNARTEKTVN